MPTLVVDGTGVSIFTGIHIVLLDTSRGWLARTQRAGITVVAGFRGSTDALPFVAYVSDGTGISVIAGMAVAQRTHGTLARGRLAEVPSARGVLSRIARDHGAGGNSAHIEQTLDLAVAPIVVIEGYAVLVYGAGALRSVLSNARAPRTPIPGGTGVSVIADVAVRLIHTPGRGIAHIRGTQIPVVAHHRPTKTLSHGGTGGKLGTPVAIIAGTSCRRQHRHTGSLVLVAYGDAARPEPR